MRKLILKFLLIALIFKASYTSAQWSQVSSGMGQTDNVLSMYSSSTVTLAGLNWQRGIFYSTNEGQSWSASSVTTPKVNRLTEHGTNYYACTSDGFFKSANGSSWYMISLNGIDYYDVVFINNYMFIGSYFNGVYYSTNEGSSWIQTSLNNKSVISLAILNNVIIAGTVEQGIYYTSDMGVTWNNTDIYNKTVNRIITDGTWLYAGTSDGVYKSSNYGANWIQAGLQGKNANDLLIYENYIYAGTDYYGVYCANRQQLIWNTINDGLPTENLFVKSLAVSNNYFFAGTDRFSVYRRPKSQINVENISKEMPSKFSLKQNYPNPFNPITNIEYDVKKSGLVTIKVFDCIGKELETLVKENQLPGTYRAIFDGSKYSSGIYFYRIHAGEFSVTKKMVLNK